MRYVGLDIETYDPCLKDAGWSWKYDKGYVLCTALYYADTEETHVIPGIHYDHPWYDCKGQITDQYELQKEANKEILRLFFDPEVVIVGANLQYDIGWLLHEYHLQTYDVRCSFVDVLAAEHILDEFGSHSLESVSQKYLNYGKTKDRIEDWVHENVSQKGDFRQYLKDAPWELLDEYVRGDAQNPVKVWQYQYSELSRQDLLARAQIEFECILPILQISINGFPFDNEKRKENCRRLEHYRDLFQEQFIKQYGLKSFKVGSSKQIAALCDQEGIPYNCKITLKGWQGHTFVNDEESDNAFNQAKRYVANFRLEKGKGVAYVPSTKTKRTCEILDDAGFIYNCSPNVDKKFFDSQRDNYPLIDLLANWKLCDGIISKILGDKYERFLCPDGRIRPQFKITDTTSFRLSSDHPNVQQIPSKGGFKVTENGEEINVVFPDLIRSLFHAEKGGVYFKIDYGQIEYRLICNIAVGEGSEEVRAEFAKNPRLDFHQYVVDLTGLSRKYAKNMSFGVSFGMGLPSMCANFGWTREKGEEISEKYHHHMPFVAPTLAAVGDLAKEKGFIRTVCGSHARLPYYVNKYGEKVLEKGRSYTMLNRYTQGSGAEILKCSIIRAYREGIWKKLKFHTTVHDELGFTVMPTEEQVREAYKMSHIMTSTIPLKVPLIADIELGMDWQNVKEVGEWLELRDSNAEEWQKAPEELKETVRLCEKVQKESL